MGEQVKTLKYVESACEIVDTRRNEREQEEKRQAMHKKTSQQTALFSSETIHKFIDEEEQER